MENLFQSLIQQLEAYPEAPYILGALFLLFAISLLVVLREVVAWFLKTSKIYHHTQKLELQLEEIRNQLDRLQGQTFGKASKTHAHCAPEAAPVEKIEPQTSPKVENKIFARHKPAQRNSDFPLSH